MALKTTALTTVQRVADFMGLGTLDSNSAKYIQIERMINSVTEYIERYIGYNVKKTTYANEKYDSNGGESICLKNFPLVSSEEVILQVNLNKTNEDDWETVDSKYFFVDYESGILSCAGGYKFFRGKQIYRVSYTAGYDFDNSSTFLSDTDAGDLELAAWQLIATAYNRRKSGAGVQSEQIGDYRVVYAGSMFENADIKSILQRYKKMEAGGTNTPLAYS